VIRALKNGSVLVGSVLHNEKTISFDVFDEQLNLLETFRIGVQEVRVGRIYSINDDLLAYSYQISSKSPPHVEMFSLSQRQRVGELKGLNFQPYIKQLQHNPNLLVTIDAKRMAFWTISDCQIISELDFDFNPLNVCEMEDGILATWMESKGDILLISLQSMKVLRCITNILPSVISSVTEIRKGVVVLNSPNDCLKVVNLKQNRCLLDLNRSISYSSVVKYAEGMFLVIGEYEGECIQGWNDNGECWLYIRKQYGFVSHFMKFTLMACGDVAVTTRDNKLEIYSIPDRIR